MNRSANGELMARLASHVQAMPAVERFVHIRGAGSIKEEAWEIAHGLADVQESALRIIDNLIPRLLQAAPEGEEAEDLLYEIGEEYRHILYHISNTRFFGYVVTDTSEALEAPD
jgi:hypothetical protein